MTGADPAAFADVAARADVFAVSPGRVEAHAAECNFSTKTARNFHCARGLT